MGAFLMTMALAWPSAGSARSDLPPWLVQVVSAAGALLLTLLVAWVAERRARDRRGKVIPFPRPG